MRRWLTKSNSLDETSRFSGLFLFAVMVFVVLGYQVADKGLSKPPLHEILIKNKEERLCLSR